MRKFLILMSVLFLLIPMVATISSARSSPAVDTETSAFGFVKSGEINSAIMIDTAQHHGVFYNTQAMTPATRTTDVATADLAKDILNPAIASSVNYAEKLSSGATTTVTAILKCPIPVYGIDNQVVTMITAPSVVPKFLIITSNSAITPMTAKAMTSPVSAPSVLKFLINGGASTTIEAIEGQITIFIQAKTLHMGDSAFANDLVGAGIAINSTADHGSTTSAATKITSDIVAGSITYAYTIIGSPWLFQNAEV